MCKKNVAVVFTTRFENNERINEGLCIKCAYETGIGGIEEMFSAAGINADNIDEVTNRLNRLMSGTESANPEDLFKMLVDESGPFGSAELPELDEEMDYPYEEEGQEDSELPFQVFHMNGDKDEPDDEDELPLDDDESSEDEGCPAAESGTSR